MSVNKILRYGLMATNIVFTAGILVAAGVILGLYLDRSFGMSPLFIVLFSLLGLAAGIWSLISSVMKLFNSR